MKLCALKLKMNAVLFAAYPPTRRHFTDEANQIGLDTLPYIAGFFLSVPSDKPEKFATNSTKPTSSLCH